MTASHVFKYCEKHKPVCLPSSKRFLSRAFAKTESIYPFEQLISGTKHTKSSWQKARRVNRTKGRAVQSSFQDSSDPIPAAPNNLARPGQRHRRGALTRDSSQHSSSSAFRSSVSCPVTEHIQRPIFMHSVE